MEQCESIIAVLSVSADPDTDARREHRFKACLHAPLASLSKRRVVTFDLF